MRSQGIGEALVDRWKEWLLSEGVPLGFTSAGTGAASFYQRCGFQLCTGPFVVWTPA